ncbi:hypothetical protein MCUN1_001127 [Malassezia cuniculi]|uniref:Mitochondrial zinc maintenance protein 1, mitochondrial n=1 Tax=Malassezia cuniculi TaxID=948313 RepID=A0AAF0J5J9_9BASI|nr:hypothetical protein MCUN1_001127 [Malassezia cuniculi]
MSSISPAQRQRANALYRALLRTTRTLFAQDAAAVRAAHDETRRRFVAARDQTDAESVEKNLTEAEQVISLLRHNVVQGVYQQKSNTYNLRFTPDTELGSNETIMQPKPAPTLEEIARTKGKARGIRAYSTIAGSARAFSTSAAAASSLPRPVPRFPAVVILADGSSIQMTTTSPRHLSRLTRDPTNHPLWNPAMSGRSEGESEDDTGRLGRFRRRFADEKAVAFDTTDLNWMSGGREATPGTPLQSGKAKGKGRK